VRLHNKDLFPGDYHAAAQALREQHGGCWAAAFTSVGCVLEAYRVQHAVDDKAVKVADVEACLAQALFDQTALEPREDDDYGAGAPLGRRFCVHVYHPEQAEPKGAGHVAVAANVDHPHKLKGNLNALKRQPLHDVESDEARRVLISKSRIKAVCDDATALISNMQAKLNPLAGGFLPNVRKAQREATMLNDVYASMEHPDKHNVPIAEHVFTSELLRAKLIERGWKKDAKMLQLFGDAHIAFTQPGLTSKMRTRMIRRLSLAIKDVFGSGLFDAKALKQRRLAGWPTELLFAHLYNADAREHILGLDPSVEKYLVETTLGTDMLETAFGMLVMKCGWKPTYDIAVRVMHNIEYIQQLKRDPSHHLTLSHTQHSKYSHAKRCAILGDGAWQKGLDEQTRSMSTEQGRAWHKMLDAFERGGRTATRRKRQKGANPREIHQGKANMAGAHAN
jgi:hypothetical protein